MPLHALSTLHLEIDAKGGPPLATQIDLLATLQEIDQQLQRKELLLQELRQQVSAISSEMEKTEQEAEAQQQRVQEPRIPAS